MHPEEIKAALSIAGYRQVRLAHDLNVAQSVVSRVIAGHTRSGPIEQRISEITGIATKTLWPQWYGDRPPLTLTDEEYDLVLAFRAAAARQRGRALRALSEGQSDASASVHADHHSVAAGGDVTIGHAAGRKGTR